MRSHDNLMIQTAIIHVDNPIFVIYTGMMDDTSINDADNVCHFDENDVFMDITETLNNGMLKISDVETRYTKANNLKEDIKSLERQQLDGLLSHQDVSELT